MSADDRRDLRHYQRLASLNAAFRGVVAAALGMADDGTLTAADALDMIRAHHTPTETAINAANAEWQGDAS